jgi:hypothetical protein
VGFSWDLTVQNPNGNAELTKSYFRDSSICKLVDWGYKKIKLGLRLISMSDLLKFMS